MHKYKNWGLLHSFWRWLCGSEKWVGWGIKFGWPTKQLVVRRLTCISPESAAIALGSEIWGGIQDVRAEDITAIHRIKTASSRERRVCEGHICKGNDHAHHEIGFFGGLVPMVPMLIATMILKPCLRSKASTTEIWWLTMSPWLLGWKVSPMTLLLESALPMWPLTWQSWTCTDIEGITIGVTPKPCNSLPD